MAADTPPSSGVGHGRGRPPRQRDMKKRWKLKPPDRDLQEILCRELDILPVTAQLLVNRGLVERDKASLFLRPDLGSLHDPFSMTDMDKAVERVLRAIAAGEKIAIWGDYDVDGTTATALLQLFFREAGVDVLCYIPDRRKEGYGLNAEGIKGLAASGATLVITVDCGSSDAGQIAFAASVGIDLIVTDHHEMKAGRPPAFAVLNPKQEGCGYPFKGLAGVGVAFCFARSMRTRMRDAGMLKGSGPNLKRYLDLVSIGTVADMVPLVDENRVYVSYGLKELEKTTRPGLRALMEVCGIRPGKVDSGTVAFQLAPRINAAGRLAHASAALRLMVTEDESEARRLARDLDSENVARQTLEAETLEKALSMLEGASLDRGIVLFSEEWHPGVIGIVASRLVERFARPVVMIAIDGGVGKGSARGIRSFDILAGLIQCSGLLERFGGHKAAAGLTVKKENLAAFRDEFIRYINGVLTDEDLTHEIDLDAEVSLADVDARLVSEIEGLAPFGVSNREPLLCLTDAHIGQTEVVGAKHLRLTVRQDGLTRPAIGFGLAGMHPMSGAGFNLAFSPYMDEWQGAKNLKLRVKDVRQGTQKS